MSLGKDAQRARDYFLPVGEEVRLYMRDDKSQVGKLENAIFHEDGKIAAVLLRVSKGAIFVPWHSVVKIEEKTN
jgi:hypothetical protein